MARRARWPDRPPVEDEAALEGHLDAISADAETRAFCRDLAQDGVARIDLGDALGLCDQVAGEMDRHAAARGAKRVQDGWLRSPATRRLATHPKVERLLRAAYGRPPFAFQTLTFRMGTQQPVHSDAIHFHSRPERFMCGVWTALEDVSADAGPLTYRAGSHKLPVLTMRSAGLNRDRPSEADYDAVYLPALHRRLDEAACPARTALLRKGEALVWAANLAHGGAPVADASRTRRSLVTHFYFKDCLYFTPMLSDVEGGALALRLPHNLGSGLVEWPRVGGRFLPLPRGEVYLSLRQLLTRRPHVE